MERVLFFERFGYFLSNFSSFKVCWRGRQWMTAEHAYQSGKFDDETITEEIRLATSSHDAKRIARLHEGAIRESWADEKLDIMKEIIRAKIEQHEYIREQLLVTDGAFLVEDSPVDDFWGRGSDWQGSNHLGKIWMELREELVAQQSGSEN